MCIRKTSVKAEVLLTIESNKPLGKDDEMRALLEVEQQLNSLALLNVNFENVKCTCGTRFHFHAKGK